MGKDLKKTRQKKEEIFATKEVREFEDHLFDVRSYGGQEDVNAFVKRYEKKTTITEEEREALLKDAPPAPEFEVLDRAKYNERGCWKKRTYRKQVEGYFKSREKYFTTKVDKRSIRRSRI